MTVTESIREKAPEVPAPTPRPVRHCQGCGERSGSVSAGTGRPLMRDKASGLFFHVSCKPGAASMPTALATLSGLGA